MKEAPIVGSKFFVWSFGCGCGGGSRMRCGGDVGGGFDVLIRSRKDDFRFEGALFKGSYK